MEQGKPLPATDPSLDFNHRTASWYMPPDQPWQDCLKFQEKYERENPEAAAA